MARRRIIHRRTDTDHDTIEIENVAATRRDQTQVIDHHMSPRVDQATIERDVKNDLIVTQDVIR